MQHPASLGIGHKSVFPEHFLGGVVFAVDHRSGVTAAAGEALTVAVKAVAHLIETILVAGEQVRVIRGKSLVEPDMAPVLAGDEVAEPLVRQLVSHQPLAAADVFRLIAEQRGGVERGLTGVFHAAPVEVLHANLVVLRPRIRHADFLFKKLHARLRVAERVGGVGEVGRRGPERHRQVAVLLLDALEVTGDKRDEVVDVRLVLTPLDDAQARVGIDGIADFPAIGQNDHRLGHAAGHGGGEKLVGRVKAREPVPRLDRFALRPDMRVAGVVAHFRCAEVEALFRLGLVGDGELGLLARRDRIGEGDDQRAVGVLPSGDLRTAGGDITDLEVVRVEAQLTKRLEDRPEGERGGAGNAAILEVRRDVEVELLDVHSAVRRVALGRRVDARPNGGAVAALQAVNVLGLGQAHDAQRQNSAGEKKDGSFHFLKSKKGR